MMRFPGRLALAFPLAVSGHFVKSEVVLTDSQLETPEASDDAAWLRKGLEYSDDAKLTDAERQYLDGDAPSVSQWSGGEDWEFWLTEAMEKLPETGVDVDDHEGRPIGEGESIGLVAAEMVMDKDQVSKLPEEFQSGLFKACPAAGCPKWPVGLRISHTNAGVDLTRFALKVGAEDGEIDLTFTETLKSFPIANKEQLHAFAFSVKYGKIAALARYPLEMGALTMYAVKDTVAAKWESEMYAAVSKDYYSLTPYLIGGHGAGQRPGAMKYRLVPTSAREPFPDKGQIQEQGFKKTMRDQAAKHISAASHSFSFEIQVATQASKQPLNDANAEWDEETAPWVKMGTVTIPKQDFTQPETVGNAVGSGLWHDGRAPFNSKEFLFTPGQSPHRPLGDINVFRADLYPSYDNARQKYLLQKSGGMPVKCPFKDIATWLR